MREVKMSCGTRESPFVGINKCLRKELLDSYKKNKEMGGDYLRGFFKDLLDPVVLASVGCRTMRRDNLSECKDLYDASVQPFKKKKKICHKESDSMVEELSKFEKESDLMVEELLKFEEENYTQIKRGTKPCCDSRCNMRPRKSYKDSDSGAKIFSSPVAW